MKITSAMLPFELVREVKDDIEAQVSLDRQELDYLQARSPEFVHSSRLAAILKYGSEDRATINRALAEGSIALGSCYNKCHHCCSMDLEYEVETFDILLSYTLNSEAVQKSYRAGRLEAGGKWCGLLEDGLCSIHQYKPYTCLLTLPPPQGAVKKGCYFKGDKNARIQVHKPTMVVTGRMRVLFKEYLPDLPEFAGRNINQAFRWTLHMAESFRRG